MSRREYDVAYPSRLGVLLHDKRHSVHQLRRGDRLMIHEVVVLKGKSEKFTKNFLSSHNLCHLSCSADEKPVIRSHPTVHHANVSSDLEKTCIIVHFLRKTGEYLFNLVGGVVFKQNRLVLLLSGKDTPIHRLMLTIQ